MGQEMNGYIPSYLALDLAPQANPAAIVTGAQVRFTVLTPRLLRLEFSPSGTFVDQASQLFWYRDQPVPDFQVEQSGEALTITTDHLRLRYHPTPSGFTAETLSIEFLGSGKRWRYGQLDEDNLRGTMRTLDLTSGAAQLEAGLLSRVGWSVVDDSDSLLFNAQGWLEPRPISASQDLYFFGYGDDYGSWLADYLKVAGRVPLLPRWALGNWWSRYWAYSQEELMELVREFEGHEVPLSVCIVDMDWHITDTGNEASGWTGYTWNKTLFPEPEAFLEWLHQRGLRAALNLHPAEGVYPHEARYDEVARFMGMEPESGQPIPFDIANPRFARAYFKYLHHPLEAQGVDFWWLDWQQGTVSSMPGLDPLWWLNHLHFYDRARQGEKRPFIFSRWGGLGNHRYPVGFSGDTYVDWPSLAFQPYQTATAANVAFGWWSHDIGGHMWGVEEAELYTRWVQFGVFSPIMRLHSTKNRFHERRPWGYDSETFAITRRAMQLRHALIPYLYTMSWRYSQKGIAPIHPLYHDYPQLEAAYHCPDEYTFGSELLVAPFISPADPSTQLSRQVVWLPPGDWFHFFDGRRFSGESWQAIYGGLDEIPVFARAGAIVPLTGEADRGIENPNALDLVLFPGADNRFELYEDNGSSLEYRAGAYVVTAFQQAWQSDRLSLTIEPAHGDLAQIPHRRRYRLHIRGINPPHAAWLHVNGAERSLAISYDAESHTAQLEPFELAATDEATVTVSAATGELMQRGDQRLRSCRRMVAAFKLQTAAKEALYLALPAIVKAPQGLAPFMVDLSQEQAQALLEVISGAGMHYVGHIGEREELLLWNNRQDPSISYRFSTLNPRTWQPEQRFHGAVQPVPHFKALLDSDDANKEWRLSLFYDSLLTVSRGRPDDEPSASN